jgi:phosphate-selective porin OprO/OprP
MKRNIWIRLACVLLASNARAQTPIEPTPLDPTVHKADPAEHKADTVEHKLEALDQKVRVLERRAEVAEEVAAARTAITGAKGDELIVRSANGEVTLQLRGLLQADGRVFLNDDARALADTNTPKRVRPIFAGTYEKLLKWQFTPDFGGGTVVVQDGWVEINLGDHVTLRAGKMKVPFGLERWQSAAALRFVERAYPTQLAPNRDVGLTAYGSLFDKRLDWTVGVFDGGIDNSLADSDTNDSKEVVGRLVAQPFATSENDWLKALQVGGAVSWGDQNGTNAVPNTPILKTPGQNTFYSFRNGETATDKTTTPPTVSNLPNPVANGARLRWTANLWWNGGPIGLLAEYVSVNEPVSRSGVNGNWKSSAWQGALSYVIGGKPSFTGTSVDTPFRVGANGWGALEIAGRASAISIDNGTTWADPNTSASDATSFTGGVRWHLSEHYRLFVDYEHTTFRGGATSGLNRLAEQAVLARVQLAY